jgi:phosphate uptake regulator
MATASIDNNFKFMVLELTKQIQDTGKVLSTRDKKFFDKINARDDYIDTLNNLIQTKCFALAARSKKKVSYIQAIDTITRNLEKIGDYCVSIVQQLGYYYHTEILDQYDYPSFIKEVTTAVKLLNKAFFETDVKLALKICRSEYKIDQMYEKIFQQVLATIQSNKNYNTNDCITTLFIFSFFERMGDALLNIGEAIISVSLGQKIKISQYYSLKEAANLSDLDLINQQLSVESVGETRSGCRIERVNRNKKSDREKEVIFKEGQVKKVSLEKENLEQWNALMPGLTPKIFGYHKSSKEASLILEYLHGRNFRDVVLDDELRYVAFGLELIKKTLSKIWKKSKERQSVSLNFIAQAEARLRDVYTVHPAFRQTQKYHIGSLEVHSFESYLKKAAAIERTLRIPFTVFIHGDFNLDNIIYDAYEGSVHFLDVYRSQQFDYIQDVSVFLISNFRLPILDGNIRERINWIMLEMFQFAQAFAEKNEDALFYIRLALGLIRSFITSTRFELDENFAKVMYLRALYLLESIVAHDGKPWEEFCISSDVLIY